MHVGLHHAEKRKKHGEAVWFDHFMIFAGLLGPVALIPQVLAAWTSDNVESISVLAWSLLTVGSLVWFAYGLYRRLPALIVTNALLAIFNFLVVLGVLVHR